MSIFNQFFLQMKMKKSRFTCTATFFAFLKNQKRFNWQSGDRTTNRLTFRTPRTHKLCIHVRKGFWMYLFSEADCFKSEFIVCSKGIMHVDYNVHSSLIKCFWIVIFAYKATVDCIRRSNKAMQWINNILIEVMKKYLI